MMPFIMICYYIMCGYVLSILIWNFIREKKSVDNMILYLLIMIPLLLRILRVK
jgi:hypothetical protein